MLFDRLQFEAAAYFFEEAHGRKLSPSECDLVARYFKKFDPEVLASSICHYLDLPSSLSSDDRSVAFWALGKYGHPRLLYFFRRHLAREVKRDMGVAYQIMIALDNLGEPVWQTGERSFSIQEVERNREAALAYLQAASYKVKPELLSKKKYLIWLTFFTAGMIFWVGPGSESANIGTCLVTHGWVGTHASLQEDRSPVAPKCVRDSPCLDVPDSAHRFVPSTGAGLLGGCGAGDAASGVRGGSLGTLCLGHLRPLQSGKNGNAGRRARLMSGSRQTCLVKPDLLTSAP